MLSFPPLPVVPASGETQILQNAIKFAKSNQLNALDNAPIPFAVVGTNLTTGVVNIVRNNPQSASSSRVDIDVDSNPNTGKGGKDLSVSVSTELFLNGVFNPHLLETVDRLGSAPFATNYEVLLSFPFSAFSPEFLNGTLTTDPNLFIGFKTTGAAGPDAPGGSAPLQEQIRFVPNIMSLATHPSVQLNLATTGPTNPLQYITGYFDAAAGSGLAGIKDAAAYAAWVQNPPPTAAINVGVSNSLPLGSPFNGAINFDWTNTGPRTKVVFDYLEDESFAAADKSNLPDSDFDTKVTFDTMPNHETLSLGINEAAKSFSLTHNGHGQTIPTVQVLSERKHDGLKIVGTATDVPTDVQLTLGLGGTSSATVPAVQLDVTPLGAAAGAHDNNLDLKLEVTKTGGFLNTADFLGYNIGYVAVTGSNLPDLTAGYLAATDSYGLKATNPGESIGYVELAIDDDGHYTAIADGLVKAGDTNHDFVINELDANYTGVVDNRNVTNGKVDVNRDGIINGSDDGTVAGIPVIDGQFDVNHSGGVNAADDQASFLVGLATPPHYFDGLPGQPGTLRHIFSLVDDGTHGTAIARLVSVVEASLNLNAADISEAFTLKLGAAVPMTAYLQTKTTSNIIPGHDVEVEADVENIPLGQTTFAMDPPDSLSYTTNPSQGIAFIHIFGHIDNTFFDLIAGNLPAVFSYHFDPDGSLSLFADDGDGVPEPASPGDQVGLLGLVMHNAIDADGLSGAVKELFGAPIRDAAFRVNDIPSFHATWADTPAHTTVNFDTDQTNAFLGGAQVEVRTDYDPVNPLTHLPSAAPLSAHYLRFQDDGSTKKRLAAGVFAIDSFAYASDDAASTYDLHFHTKDPRPLNVSFDSAFGGKFFPQYDTLLTSTVDAVPDKLDLTVDLDPSVVYTASGGISSITLIGTIDDTNDSVDNGTDVSFTLLGLPASLRVGVITDEVKIIDGRLDVNGSGGVDGSDDGQLAGVNVIDGRLDLNSDGNANGSDDGKFFGIEVVDGELNVDGIAPVNGDDDGGVAGVDVAASGKINEVGALLQSVNNARGIFGGKYKLIQALVDDIPAQFVISYGGDRFLFDSRNAAGNPVSVGKVSALVSSTKVVADNNDKVKPFTLDGPVQSGPVLGDPAVTGAGPGGSRINYSQFLQEIDKRYYDAGSHITAPSGVLTRLAELYADSEQLDLAEDHVIVRKEDLDSTAGDEAIGFASLQFSKFQHASWTPNAHGGQFAYRAPGRANAPFFGGYEADDKFTTLQIEHVPDSIDVDIDDRDHAVYTASAAPGEIDLYQGPGNTTDGLFANDTDNAMRAIMRNAPSSVRVFWDFSFPNGGAFMDASNPFELLFLTQDGSHRITAGAALEDLDFNYGIDLFSFNVTKSITIPNPIPFCPNLVIPVAWELFKAGAAIDNDADGLTKGDIGGFSHVGANMAKQDVAGFVSVYNLQSAPAALTPAGPAAGSSEFIPFVTVMTEGFRSFEMDFVVELDPTNPGATLYPIDLEFNVNTSQVGNLTLDIWSPDDTHFTDNGDIPLIPEVGFVNPPDYSDNTPFHILPGLYPDTVVNGLKGIHVVHDWVVTFDGFSTFNEHFDPFAGTPAPFTGSTGDGGFDAGEAAFIIQALSQFGGALTRWESALDAAFFATNGGDADAAHSDATNLVNKLANNTSLVVQDFSGATLGTATGNSNGAIISIDPDGGGFDWFVDPTPDEDSEFTGGGPPPADLTAPGASPANGKVDMLSFFIHEIGHVLGLDHSTDGIMQATLPRSVRRLPTGPDYASNPLGGASSDTDDVAALIVKLEESDELWWFGPF